MPQKSGQARKAASKRPKPGAAKRAARKPAKPASKKKGKVGKVTGKAGAGKPSSNSKPRPAARAKSVKARPPAAVRAKGQAKAAKPAAKGVAPAPNSTDNGQKAARKGITIVSQKPTRKTKSRSTTQIPLIAAPLMQAGLERKPLIQSGPNAPKPGRTILGGADKQPRKPVFDKRQLARFREVLLRKRAELVGDISHMETEALMGQSGSLSHLPQHMADQGSDAYDQSLSLDLAAADRRLIKEIDDALGRIAAGTYGVCVLTGKPIKVERLEELPWARYSIEAARELERRSSIP